MAQVMGVPHPKQERGRVLDPIARISEVLFGLIMALTFTSTLGATEVGREEVHTLLFGAIGCNIAWGLVDAVMYLMNVLTERGRDLLMLRSVRGGAMPADAHQIITGSVSPVLASVLTPPQVEAMRHALIALRDIPPRASLTKDDWRGAAGVFLLVVLSTLPVVIPFLFVRQVQTAVRVSNLVAIAMLFAAGYLLARYAGYHPWRTGLSMVVLGVALVAITIALGG